MKNSLLLLSLVLTAHNIWGRDTQPVPQNLVLVKPILGKRPPGDGIHGPTTGMPIRPRPGAIIHHSLSCTVPSAAPNEKIRPVSYSMTCDTQALAPKYSLRGCTLEESSEVSEPAIREIKLEQTSQNARSASFKGKTEKHVSVRVDKTKMSAKVQVGVRHFECIERHIRVGVLPQNNDK